MPTTSHKHKKKTTSKKHPKKMTGGGFTSTNTQQLINGGAFVATSTNKFIQMFLMGLGGIVVILIGLFYLAPVFFERIINIFKMPLTQSNPNETHKIIIQTQSVGTHEIREDRLRDPYSPPLKDNPYFQDSSSKNTGNEC